MAVANDTILKKIRIELQEASNNQHNKAEMLKHIANVRLLCDLFLTEDLTDIVPINTPEISEAELKAMIGKEEAHVPTQLKSFKKSIELDDEDGNGDSIFDF